MSRTDRLFDIIQVLRSAPGPISAASIATTLEVPPRTIYRDMATLQAMRIPIEGEVGVGYVMGRGYDLPPLNFDEEELESIVVGVNLLARTGDKALQRA
ncbi:MAG: HTH domain-containing protein, partial [Alphaproteobacteria bacterium]